MTHFGIICPAGNGHLNPMTTLGRELQRRRHHVTLIGVLDAQPNALAAGLNFSVIAESEFPLGATARSLAQLGKLNGLAALRYTVSVFQESTALLLRDVPAVIKKTGVEALLVDETTSAGGTVAEFLGIPFITVCCALVLNQEDAIPPFFTPWSYNPVWWARLRNQASYSFLRRIAQPIRELIDGYRQQWQLPPHSSSNAPYSKLAIISQQPAEFDFPRTALPQWFHFTGPYYDSSGRQRVDFPFDKLTGQPLIYASMGTVQNRLIGIFQKIASACEGLDVQLVISLGGSAIPESLPQLPENCLVVKYAPQLELLKNATLTITHAGMNTTLESLSKGVAMVAIPIANDQPGVASRIAWTGAGEVVPLFGLSVLSLRVAIQRVLTQDSYKNNATRLQAAINRFGGVSRAADIIEQAISTKKPVLAET